MADNLIFPVKFDLEKGVKDAIKDWNDKYAKKLEDYLSHIKETTLYPSSGYLINPNKFRVIKLSTLVLI